MNANTQFKPDFLVWPAAANEVPKVVFENEEIYRLELERLFYGPIWHPVAHEAEIPNAGDYKTTFVGELPIVVSRGEDNRVYALHNACAHRGTMLVTNFLGNRKVHECPYHRWAYDATGKLIGCPGTDRFPASFKREDFGLKPIKLEILAGMVFVTLDPKTPPLDEQLGSTKAAFCASLGGDGRLKLLGYQKITYNANWKAYRDQDGYHAPLLHAAFKMLNWQGGRGTCYMERNGNMAMASELAIPPNSGFLKDPSLLEFKGVDPKVGSYVVAPSIVTITTKHLDMINIRFAMPKGRDKIEVHWAYFAHQDDDEEMVRHRLRQSSNLLGPSGLVSIEDAAVFNRIQKALVAGTPNNYFMKGVIEGVDPINSGQNDESANLVWWEYYRGLMGFERAA